MLRLQTLSGFLKIVHDLPVGFLYLRGDYPWTAETVGVVYPTDMGDDLEYDQPEYVRQNNLKLVLEVAAVQDIVIYTKQQKPAVTIDDLVRAFNHYYKHDGFLEL